MTDSSRWHSQIHWSVTAAIGILAVAIFAGAPKVVMAHSFIVALDATAADPPEQLTSAIQGMRLAAGERDSHAAETSDGHLGGIDLFIRVVPAKSAEGITWLRGAPNGAATIVVDFSNSESGPSHMMHGDSVVIGPGVLPAGSVWSADAIAVAEGFVARYHAAYGTAPDRQAAQGYNVALRIDRAIRDQGGVQDSRGLQQSLDLSAGGIDW